MTVLDVQRLNVSLGGRHVLTDVNITVDAGDFVGLIGPNGAGKTTLLRSILGLLRPQSGQVLVDGQPMRPGRGSVGYVPQRHDFAWEFPISVEDVVLSGRVRDIGWLRPAKIRDHLAVTRALEMVDMAPLRLRTVGELSGGQRQRVLVARALAREPRLLLLDEPFTGLDIPTQEILTRLFDTLAGEGRAVLMTTHDLTGAMHSCGRVVLINGSIIADATPEQLRRPEPWIEAFEVTAASPLLASLGVS